MFRDLKISPWQQPAEGSELYCIVSEDVYEVPMNVGRIATPSIAGGSIQVRPARPSAPAILVSITPSSNGAQAEGDVW